MLQASLEKGESITCNHPNQSQLTMGSWGQKQVLRETTYRPGTAITSTIFILKLEHALRQRGQVIVFEFTVGVLGGINFRMDVQGRQIYPRR